MDEIRSALSEFRRSVIFGVCETWLNSSVPNGEVAIPSYDLYSCDHRSKGGGVPIYVPERCRSKRRPELESKEVEIIWIKMRLNRRLILIGMMYRPPHVQSLLFTELETMLERVSSEGKDIVLMGDLNINLLATTCLSSKLTLIANENNLKQLISKPTRITDHSQTLMNVLFTSSPDLFMTTGITELTRSDHLMIYGECTARIQKQSKICTIRTFKKCNVDELANAPWQVMEIFDHIDDKWSYWKSPFLNVVNSYAPLMKVRVNRKAPAIIG